MFFYLPFVIGLFIFILSLMWMLESYCAKCWLRFGVILAWVLLSGAFVAIQLYVWLGPKPHQEGPMDEHQTTAL